MAFPTTGVLDDFNTGASQALSARAGWSANYVFAGTTDFTTDVVPTTAVSTASSSNLWGTNFTNCEVWTTLGALGQVEIDLYARWTGSVSRNGYSLIWIQSGPQFYIARVDGGVNTTISSVVAQSLSAGDSMGLYVVGSSMQGWYKAAAGSWTMLVSASDATYSASAAIGIDSYSASNTLDAFGGGSASASGPSSGSLLLLGVGA